MSYDELPTCATSQAILNNVGHTDKGRSLSTAGDGNCLFNSLSMLLCGNSGQSMEIRYRTAIELILNGKLYEEKHKKWENMSNFVSHR